MTKYFSLVVLTVFAGFFSYMFFSGGSGQISIGLGDGKEIAVNLDDKDQLSIETTLNQLLENESSKDIVLEILKKKFDLYAKNQTTEMPAMIGGVNLITGQAAVCTNSDFMNKYLLLMDNNTGGLIQVFAVKSMPCTENDRILLSAGDVKHLGWIEGSRQSKVVVSTAMPGYKFQI